MPHPRHLGEVLSSSELSEWLAYSALEPFGSPADDVRQGGMVAAIYNVNRDTRVRADPYSFHDMLPWCEVPRRVVEATPEDQEAAFDRLFAGG